MDKLLINEADPLKSEKSFDSQKLLSDLLPGSETRSQEEFKLENCPDHLKGKRIKQFFIRQFPPPKFRDPTKRNKEPGSDKETENSSKLSGNGFTALEILLVILVVVILLQCFSIASRPDRLTFFARNLLNEIQGEQYQAMYHRESRQVAIDRDHLELQERRIAYPDSITCEAQVIRFNEKGNISKGGTVSCQNSGRQVRLVFQLGAGRGRIDYE